MKVSSEGKKRYRILLWGSVLKREVDGELMKRFYSGETNFEVVDSESNLSTNIDGINITTNLVKSKLDENLQIEFYWLANKRDPPIRDSREFSSESVSSHGPPPFPGKKSKTKWVVLNWLDDYLEEEQRVLYKIFSDTEGVMFIVNTNKYTEDKQGFSIKPRNEWELTKNSLRMLKDVAGNDLGTKIPLIVLCISPYYGGPIKAIASPNSVKIEEIKEFLTEEDLFQNKTIILEVPNLAPKISTVSINAFKELMGFLDLL